MRPKIKNDYGMKHMYQFYKKKYVDPMEYSSFTAVINIFNQLMIEAMYQGSYLRLPYNLGDMFIYRYKPRYEFDNNGQVITKNIFNMIDYKATKELWKEYPELKHKQRVCYDNFHTDGYKYKISWKRYHATRTHKLYNFKPARAFKRGLAVYLREHPNQDYYG